MISIRRVLIVIISLLCTLTQGHAAVRTYAFVGTITDGGSVGGASGNAGETISGEFSYDTDAFNAPLSMAVPPIVLDLPNGSLVSQGTTSVPLYSSDAITISGGLQDPTSPEHNIDIDIYFSGLLVPSNHPPDAFPQGISLDDYTSATGAFSSFSLPLGPLGDPIFFSIDTLSLRAPPTTAGVAYLASDLTSTTFLNLSTLDTPYRTRSIEFDSDGDLYIEDPRDDVQSDFTRRIQVLKLDALTGYNSSVIFSDYLTDPASAGITGLDFDDIGSLYVSEISQDGNSGVIREVDVASQTLQSNLIAPANHRPTGVDADNFGNVFYSGRKESDGTWGNIYAVDSTATRTIIIENTVATGVAVDISGNVFISTPQRTDLALLPNSIYMFDSVDLLNPTLIARFDQAGGELTFDASGDLYMVAQDQESIFRLSTNPAIWGDIDDDGDVDIADVLLATQGVLGSPLSNEQLSRGNVAPLVNGTPQPVDPYEALDTADLLLITQKALSVNAF